MGEPKLCRRHVRQGPIWMEDPAKAAAMYGMRAALKEDPTSCYICVARAAALYRIKAAGGDSVKAAEDSESRAGSAICVTNVAGCATREGIARQDGAIKVRDSHIKWLLTGSRITPLRPLSEDYFQENPNHRATCLSSAFQQLAVIDKVDNILSQFFEKGYAMTELQVEN